MYIYEANNWTSSQTTRYSVNGGSVYPCLNSPFNVTSFVEGQNYVIIRDIKPVNGQIVLTVSGVEGNGILNGFQLVTGAVVGTPTFAPGGRYINGPTAITITSGTIGANIYYTTDGSTPSATNGALYSSPVSVSAGYDVEGSSDCEWS